MHYQEELPAIPLWINGHAYLTVTAGFETVRSQAAGQSVRRIPLCGPTEVARALESARAALPGWAALPEANRMTLLSAVGDALERYAGHFAALITEESGKTTEAAEREVTAVSELLRNAPGHADSGVRLLCGNSAEPLAGALRLAIPALLSGRVVVVNTPPEAPSALFAWAELTARAGWPGGVFNLVHGREAVMAAFRETGVPLQRA